MTEKKRCHIIVPHYNGKYDIIRAFLSIKERTIYPYILTIIDDGSSKDDPGYQFLKHLDTNRPDWLNIFFNEENVGVTKNLNKAFAMYPDLDCVRLDADIEIQSLDWLNVMADFMEKNKNVGVCGPIGVEKDFVTVQTAGQRLIISPDEKLPLDFQFEYFDRMGEPRFNLPGSPIEVDAVLGCCAYYRSEVIKKLGGVDEKYFGWVEDNDFCMGARSLGYKCFVLPNISYNHWGHGPKRPADERDKILANSEKRFIEKWKFSLYEPQPYFDEIKKLYAGTEIFWRYNEKI